MSSNPHPEAETQRLTASEIFDAAVSSAREELKRSSRKLAFSGFAGGLTMGLTALAVASIRAVLGDGGWQDFVSYLFYPIGFIAVIIGRSQLFTENTLYPVVLVLDERRHFLDTLRLWVVVFSSNIVGALAFAFLSVRSGALQDGIRTELIEAGLKAVAGTSGHLFWSGVIGGWLIALVAWMVTASHWTIGQVTMIWLLTFIVGIGNFAHCVVTSCEILCAVISGTVTSSSYFHWLLFASIGNIVGGVVIVSLLNYGQVKEIHSE